MFGRRDCASKGPAAPIAPRKVRRSMGLICRCKQDIRISSWSKRRGCMLAEVNTLLDVIEAAPGQGTALVVPESGARISYDSLREQVMTMAGVLQTAGIGRGDRVAIALPNGPATIVSFL